MHRLVSGFKALGDESRFKILEILLRCDFCVGALAHNLGISRAAVSQHLQILSKAGLVKGEKRGYWMHYTVNRSTLKNFAQVLEKMSETPSHPEARCTRNLPMAEHISDKRNPNKMCTDCHYRFERWGGKYPGCSRGGEKDCTETTEADF